MRTGFDLEALAEAVRCKGTVARTVIADFRGSTPRETGSTMLVWAGGQSGTIGGGALEFEAAARARSLILRQGFWLRSLDRMALGPALAQCCGGSVTLLTERYGPGEILELQALGTPAFIRPAVSGLPPGGSDLPAMRAARGARSGERPGAMLTNGLMVEPWSTPGLPVWLYGAGHVGRAIVHASRGLPLDLTWIDTASDRYPEPIPTHVTRLEAADPARAAAHAPADAVHLVLTYSHALDLAICHAVLSRTFGHLWLIGSASKRTRFLRRLRDLGHSEATLSRLVCPIGDRNLGKEPAAIALGVLADLVRLEKRLACRQERRA